MFVVYRTIIYNSTSIEVCGVNGLIFYRWGLIGGSIYLLSLKLFIPVPHPIHREFASPAGSIATYRTFAVESSACIVIYVIVMIGFLHHYPSDRLIVEGLEDVLVAVQRDGCREKIL